MKKLFSTQCPGCKATNEVCQKLLVRWADSGSVPVVCDKCGTEYLVPVNSDDDACGGIVFEPPQQATLRIGSKIVVVNKQHKLNGMRGKIVAKDHCNYRIEFEDGTKLWMPHHWVKKYRGGGEYAKA